VLKQKLTLLDMAQSWLALADQALKNAQTIESLTPMDDLSQRWSVACLAHSVPVLARHSETPLLRAAAPAAWRYSRWILRASFLVILWSLTTKQTCDEGEAASAFYTFV
jgi:hypothetical protein